MYDIQAIVIMSCACSLYTLILFLYTLFKFDRHDRSDYYFSILCIIIIVELMCNIPFFGCIGLAKPWYPYMLKGASFLQFFAGGLLAPAYTNYLAVYLKLDKKKLHTIRIAMLEFSALYEALALLNLRFGFFYSISEANGYVIGKYWSVAQALCILPALYDISLLIRFRNRIYKSAWTGTIIYLVLPMIGVAIHLKTTVPVTFVFASVGLYVLFFNIKSEQSLLLQKQQKELAESRISIMLSQIQPHFMYNSLTTIAVLCEKNPAEAKRATLSFSRYLRKNIDSVNKRMPVPFSSELEHVSTYLDLEKLRFGDRLNVVMDIQSTDFLIPPLTIQPLAENAVKHGICKKVSGVGTLTISSYEKPDAYEIKISDDGVGFDADQVPNDGKEHIGMENVRDRLKAMSNATMKIESVVGVGTVVTVTVPKKAPEINAG